MFHLSYSTPSDLKGKIIVNKPLYGLGNVEDIYGKIWNIKAIFGKYVNAVPVSELHEYYTSTSNDCYGFVSQTWDAYEIEVIKQ